MGEVKTYFFDTYALIEISKGHKGYSDLLGDEVNIILTKLNLMELHYTLLRTLGEAEANRHYHKYRDFCVNIDDFAIKRANEFKLRHKKRKLSYVDCLGYVIAKLRGVKFLTGDKQFANLDNVEFVK